MKWITWENVGVDRMACAWLIKKWIDSEAEFLFIPVGQKPSSEDAKSFDFLVLDSVIGKVTVHFIPCCKNLKLKILS